MKHLFTVILSLTLLVSMAQEKPELILSGLEFTEGPAINEEGELYFSDVPARKIYKFTPEQGLKVFLENSGGVNGLFFGPNSTLYACSGKEKREIMMIDMEGNTATIVSEFEDKKLNSPNDLWVDASGGIYFTDPRYGNRDNMEQEGEHVYYLSPDRKKITRVINDLVRPNGIVGTPDGKNLYVVDQGVQKTYTYKITEPGVVNDKKLFAECGIDGMSVGKNNDLFITSEKALNHFSKKGKLIHSYTFQANPTNVFYYKGVVYVTTQRGEVYRITIH